MFEDFTSAFGGTGSSVLRNSKSSAAGGVILVATKGQPAGSVPQTEVKPTPSELPAELEVPLPLILETIPTSNESGPRHSLGEVPHPAQEVVIERERCQSSQVILGAFSSIAAGAAVPLVEEPQCFNEASRVCTEPLLNSMLLSSPQRTGSVRSESPGS